MLLKLVVAGLIITLIVLFVTQILIPVLTNKKIFPAFRMPDETDVRIDILYEKHEELDKIKYADDLAKELLNKINKETK